MSKIHIFGASGSGTTTLGQALASQLQCPQYDTDYYYWYPTEPPFQQARERNIRRDLLLIDLKSTDAWVSSGSLCGWGDMAIELFDLVVYLWIPNDLRMSRLHAREIERYGKETVCPDGVWSPKAQEFLDWAADYDTGGRNVRSRALHEAWMASLPCPILRIEGDFSTEYRVERVLSRRGIGCPRV